MKVDEGVSMSILWFLHFAFVFICAKDWLQVCITRLLTWEVRILFLAHSRLSSGSYHYHRN